MKICKSWLAAGLLGATVLTAPATAAEKFFVYVSPDAIGVNAFLKMGQVGIEEAGEKYGADVETYESRTAADRLENVNAAVNEGADIVVLLGFEFNDIIRQVAPTAPDTQFLVIDQCIEDRPENVHCAVFREYEASYLMGVAAGMLTESNKVGVVGALDIPFLHRYTDGYAEGVRSVNPEAAVDIRWVGGENPFADPVRAKEQAVAMNAAGADLIFTATAGGDFGVFEAAKEKDFKAFSVDVNQCPNAPGHIVDMTLKQVDTAMVQAIGSILEGEKSLTMSLGLKEGGMSAMALEEDRLADSGCLIVDHPEVAAKMRAVAAAIKDGSLKLEDPMFAK
ncbi:BMP family ABC transporter substrate-binding protein [Nitratireductor sp. ZSWI3]|uniref:BMP family ABC transporter substrate-binding protein n=1 Tax=Nitratireductor sp. ZSWI3 TaxID=2966359 RepID=UPI00214F96FB|nr:BMP family ABC transporter substrate-binding protein [Nitratireductor sp. ZSWI3]MCR4268775.1 BMP family ABC transporter substrate-binding protein [Nitratireductor sp. ZSWI3]